MSSVDRSAVRREAFQHFLAVVQVHIGGNDISRSKHRCKQCDSAFEEWSELVDEQEADEVIGKLGKLGGAEPVVAKIDSFQGPYFFLSNFYMRPIMVADDRLYPSVEHAYQALKSLQPEQRQQIADAPTPSLAKSLGRRVALRPDWEEIKLQVMENLLRAKFSAACPDLRIALLATGDAELIEGNDWGDTYWGTVNGVGENHLGLLLMKIRNELRNQ